MGLPQYAGKHDEDALVTPQAVLAHRQARGFELASSLPPAVVITYQTELFDAILNAEATTPCEIGGPAERVHSLDRTGGYVGLVGRFGIGAPVTAIVLEELIALGVRLFVTVGVAGSLQPDLIVGDLVVGEYGIRDEGVSYHYLAPEQLAAAHPRLTSHVERALTVAGLRPRRGTTWTIDAIYRETVAEARHFAGHGALCVEMEAAALFAVASVRRVPLAAVFCISDSLAGAEWDPSYDSERLARRVWAALHVTIDCLVPQEPPSMAAPYSADPVGPA